MLKLLVVEDDDLVISAIRMALHGPSSQWRITHSSDPKNLPSGSFDAALVDMHLTGNLAVAEGTGLIAQLHKRDPHLEIVAMSGDLDQSLMEACLRAGAGRFLAKPLSQEELLLTLGKIEALLLMREAASRASMARGAAAWVGTSRASEDVRRALASLKSEPGPILIEGESGTGKEVAATLLHGQETSSRPFVTVNVAALPENVFESEFFGHVRGAFTGADQNKMGLAEAAHGGDLFLDEVEALPPSQQAKLLRFLENGEVRRVGAKDSIRVNVRLIAATNRNLENMVKEGKFREDLLWRLNGRKLLLPPLNTRPEDVEELANRFLELERPRRNKTLAPEALEALKAHAWPGNVRELKRIIEQLALQSPLPVIRREDVTRLLPGFNTPATGALGAIDLKRGLTELLAEFESRVIELSLERTDDVDAAAALLGISRSSLYKKIKDYNIVTRS